MTMQAFYLPTTDSISMICSVDDLDNRAKVHLCKKLLNDLGITDKLYLHNEHSAIQIISDCWDAAWEKPRV